MLKKFLKGLLIFSVGIGVVLLVLKAGDSDSFLSYSRIKQALYSAKEAQELVPIPEGPREASYQWEYKSKDYRFKEILYRSSYDFYKSQSKTFEYIGSLPENWEEKYYGIFLEGASNDETLEEIARKINNLGKDNRLSEDEIVELTVSFVQNIPYDLLKSKNILKGTGEERPRYPYEVLYEKKGVCSGKSFLLAALLRELGYGSALLEYESDNHMAVGVKCPKKYSVEGSGYCYTETTNPGHKIGIIPYLNAENNEAIVKKELDYFDEQEGNGSGLRKPEGVRIYQESGGKTYQGVAQTLKTVQEMEKLEDEVFELKQELVSLKQELSSKQEELRDLEKEMNGYKASENYDKYNRLVPQYNVLASEIRDSVNYYNGKVKEYNGKVDSYNQLVKGF